MAVLRICNSKRIIEFYQVQIGHVHGKIFLLTDGGIQLYKIIGCPCCEGTDLYVKDAIIAPFIASFVLNQKPQLCELARCKHCNFQFFIERFSDEEAQKLYSTYRQEDYFLERNKYEFWYTRQVNESVGEDSEIRRLIIDSFLRKSMIDFHSIKIILDYGGDRGQFFPLLFENAEKWLYDLSMNDPIPGVNKTNQLVPGGTPLFQFIMMCHLLEHVSDPHQLIAFACQSLESGGYLYLEVPEEQFCLFSLPRRINQTYLKFMLKHPSILQLIDVFSLFSRLKFGLVPPFGLVKLHEHINFFSRESFIHLLKKLNLQLINIQKTPIPKQSSGRRYVLQCIAQKL